VKGRKRKIVSVNRFDVDAKIESKVFFSSLSKLQPKRMMGMRAGENLGETRCRCENSKSSHSSQRACFYPLPLSLSAHSLRRQLERAPTSQASRRGDVTSVR